MWRDVQYGIRGLLRAPGFTMAVTLSLGLAIGANATIFGAVDALWLRPPGVVSRGELVRVFSTSESIRDGLWSFPEYHDLRERTTSFSGVAVRGRRGTILELPDGTTELELVNVVSLDFFTVLGVTAHVGRVFGPDDAEALERSPGVILAYDLWQRRYGGDPAVVGRTIRFGRTSSSVTATVLGVLPRRFRELEAASDRDMWLPPQTWTLLNGRAEFDDREFRWFDVVARRRTGVSIEQASADVAAAARSLADTYPASNRGRGARLVSELAYRLEMGGVNALALLGLVLLVVLITCVNVANLQLARSAGRVTELGVRTALGASRTKLLRQLMAENLLLGALGAAAGLLTAAWVIRLLPAILGTPPGFRAFTVFALDDRVFTFTLVVTILTTIAFGLVPSWLASRPDVVAIIKGDGAVSSWPAGGRGLRSALVAGQVAVAVVLMTAAGLFARSFMASDASALGFARKPVLTTWAFAELTPTTGQAVLAQLQGLSGVRSVAVARRAPLSLTGGGLAERVRLPGDHPDPPSGVPEIKFNSVSANYFSTLGIRLIEGRVFSEADQHGGEPVVIVSQPFARRFFPGTQAVGQRVRIGAGEGVEHLVVGVVEHVVNGAVGEEPESYFYVPYWRRIYGGEITFLIEAERDAGSLAASVRGTLRAVDPRYDPRLVATLDELVRYSVRTYRWTALLAAVLGGLGLLLTAIGVYGVVSLNTTRRTREIGIRLALGATRGEVLGLVLRDGMKLAATGVIIGVPATLLVTRLLSSMLFDVRPADPAAVVSAVTVVLVVVVIATIVPARRAVLVTPSSSLRTP